MRRFRTKSDAKRDALAAAQQIQAPEALADRLPELPPASDFRASVILPDLSRRFTILRTSTGDPLSVDLLKSRLAEQRARGAANHVTEEEEDMILETLGFRSRHTSSAERSEESLSRGESPAGRSSFRSDNTEALTSPPSSPGAKHGKRYSNNMFGSGRFRDYSYMRNAASKHANSRTHSVSAESTTSNLEQGSSPSPNLRPATPESSIPSSSTQSSPNEKGIRSAPLIPPAPYGEQTFSMAEYQLSKSLGSSVFKRASMALDEAIREIEEEVEEEIVMPRSAPASRSSLDRHIRMSFDNREAESIRSSAIYEGTAISPDRPAPSELEERRASPVPSKILPGYIPGMPRPMTPRDNIDFDEQRSHSTTPRATSPTVEPPISPLISSSIASGLYRRDSNSTPSRHSPRPTSPATSSPMFIQRSTNGRYTPEDSSRSDQIAPDFEFPSGSSAFGSRRRPASPLSNQAYQPMTLSARPTTPSSVPYAPTASASNQKSSFDHSRNGSWFSDGGSSDAHGSMDQSKLWSRSLKSPALPDSPLIDRDPSKIGSYSSTHSLPDNRPSSAISGFDLNSPVLSSNRPYRSPTPNQNASRSPTTATFPTTDTPPQTNGSRRSSRQQSPPPTPFQLGPFHPLMFSPIASSSRSSLESVGSSYHSWEGEQKDRTFSLFNDSDVQQPAWHEIISVSDQSSSATPGGSPDDEWDPEDIISRYAGLKKQDFLAIQDKLVGEAIAKKSASTESRERAPSSLRRRRPSTSQSNYSYNGGREVKITSAPQQIQAPASPTQSSFHPEQPSKSTLHSQSALLHAVVDSIQSSGTVPIATSAPAEGTSATSLADISPTRRNRDLAKVLFGLQDKDEQDTSTSEQPKAVPQPSHGAVTTPISQNTTGSLSPNAINRPPYQLPQNPSSPRLPHTPEEQAELARDVQRKTAAAMIALKKDPSQHNLHDTLYPVGSISRKRVSPNQISTPTLVSASTSVDTIPLRSPSIPATSQPGPSKIGSRFRKLRGTLRRNPSSAPSGEEVTPYPLDLRTPPATQTLHYNPTSLTTPGEPATATETGRFKVPVPSPPASAGPGLKGFMARFRGKQRAEPSIDHDRRGTTSIQSVGSTTTEVPSTPHTSGMGSLAQRARPQPLTTTQNPKSEEASSSSSTHHHQEVVSSPPLSPNSDLGSGDANESFAIQQLFDAASNLGLDRNKLNDLLLVRSGSTSSRSTDWTMLTRNTATPLSPRPESRGESRLDRDRPSTAQSHAEEANAVTASSTRKPSLRRQTGSVRRPREGRSDPGSAVVRRTIIFPSDYNAPALDLNALARKNSSRRRRVSAASFSNRSIQDRVPTPPPPRSPTARRFSVEASPPVPQLPRSFTSQAENSLDVPASQASGSIENSNSTYDSLYEMYAEEPKVSSFNEDGTARASHSNTPLPAESGPALEVIQLANGEMIWNIVNGLRDDDLESVYNSRASFASEYSTREPTEEGVKVYFKEHGRAVSKGSNSSFVPRKKSQAEKGRPETAVYYTPSSHIGRLIENLSQGQDAGTFNFSVPNGVGQSTTSSMSEDWTVEEKLEQMLGAMRTA